MSKITLNKESEITKFSVTIVSPRDRSTYGTTEYVDSHLEDDNPQVPLLTMHTSQLANAIANTPRRVELVNQLINIITRDEGDGYDDLISIVGNSLRQLGKRIDSGWMAKLCNSMADTIFNAEYEGK